MAFDIYVGGFSRYFSREWENVVQKYARESGTHYQMIGPDGPPQAANWDEVAEAVTHWKAAINNGLGSSISEAIDWDESPNAPYFTDRPGYEGYGALLVWAAHAERGTQPPTSYDGEWFSDEAFLECSVPKKGQKYRPIICASTWLPGEFEFSFDFQDLTGEKTHVCANTSLQRSLRDLNENTFGMSPSDLADVLTADLGEHASLESLARFGLALFDNLAAKSVQHRLPIMLST
ncbi:hypothetical protein SH528x_002755 [Novipirellula sp. SH528]|uniref:hypothetical protein n=1 Tax=Novipirellula sp. SH528 TaxID=3454466 RepID=UPI003FA0F301